MPWHKETDKEAQADSQIAALYASEEDKDGKAPKYKQYTYNGVSCQATSRRPSSRDDKKYMRDVKVGDTERLVHYGDPNLPMQRDIPERRENFLARHNCSEKKDPFAPGFWACLDWQRTEEGKAMNESAMVGFFLPQDIASQIALPDGEEAGDLHLTLGIMGDVREIKNLDLLKGMIQEFTRNHGPIPGYIGGVGRFNNGDSQAFYASFDSPYLPYFRQALKEVVEYSGVGGFKADYGFIPHITLKYLQADEDSPIQNLPRLALTLDTITLAVGEDRFTYQLNPVGFTSKTVPENFSATVEDYAKAAQSNCLKALEKTEEEIVTGNYIVLFGGRDLEGIASPRKNPDGSIGEYFTKNTSLESDYTSTGMLHIDWEHGQRPEEGPGKNNVLGYVDWKSAEVDDKGVFVRRVLNRRNRYVKFLEELIEAGMVGTSSEPVQEGVVKGTDGEIISWPLMRDSLTVTPMEPRMMTENQLTALKSLAEELPVIKEIYKAAGLELFEEGEEPQEVEGSTCEDNHQLEQAQAIAEAEILLIEIEGV